MAYDGWKFALEVLKTGGLAVGGLWALWIFVIQRRFAPQIEFEVGANLFAYSATENLAEFVITLQNKGLTRHKVKNLRLSARGLEHNKNLSEWQDKRLAFPHKIFSDQDAFPKAWEFSFVEPGVTQKYFYVARVPANLVFILISAEFEYRPGWLHTTSKLLNTELALENKQ